MVATERPTALDGGADRPRSATRRARRARFARRPGERSRRGRGGERALRRRGAPTIAEGLDGVRGPGDRLGRAALARARRGRRPCSTVAAELGIADRIGAGLLEVPTESNGRGLREVGCLPDSAPASPPPRRAATPPRSETSSPRRRARRRAPRQRRPGPRPTRARRLGEGAVGQLRRRRHGLRRRVHRHADVVFPAETHAEKEGTVTHPDGRLQRLRPNVPHPGEVRPGWAVLRRARQRPRARPRLDEPARRCSPRWRPTSASTPASPSTRSAATASAGRSGAPAEPREPLGRGASPTGAPTDGQSGSDGLRLGTYRDLWATGVTERNPALRFLPAQQELELQPDDAEAARRRARRRGRRSSSTAPASRRGSRSVDGCGRAPPS